jgi:hypothetical protein
VAAAVVVDAGAAAGSLVWLSGWAGAPARRFARVLALVLLASSVAANALSHGLAAHAARPARWVVVLVSGVPPRRARRGGAPGGARRPGELVPATPDVAKVLVYPGYPEVRGLGTLDATADAFPVPPTEVRGECRRPGRLRATNSSTLTPWTSRRIRR